MKLFSRKDKQARQTASTASSTATHALREIMIVKAQLEAMQRHSEAQESAENEEYQRQILEAERFAHALLGDLSEEERAIAAENGKQVDIEAENTNLPTTGCANNNSNASLIKLAASIGHILNQYLSADTPEEELQNLAELLAKSMLELTDEELKLIFDILEEINQDFVELLKTAVHLARAKANVALDTSPNNKTLFEPTSGVFWQKRAIELQTKLIEGQKSNPRMPLEQQKALIQELSAAMRQAEF